MDDPTHTPGVEKYIQRGEALNAAMAEQRVRMRKMKFDTIAVHGLYGYEGALANQGSIIEPSYLSSAQHFDNSDHLEAGLANLFPAWTYTRTANPTTLYLEEMLALLEGYGYDGEVSACVTASGMAAVSMATNPFLVVEPHGSGSGGAANFVAGAKCYGGTFMLFSQRYAAEGGVEVRWVEDPLDLSAWVALIDENTRFVYGEMPSNPSLSVFDIVGLGELAHKNDLPLIVDATVATPALMRPIYFGADIVIHSVSKSMISSGFAIAGALIARHEIPSRVGSPEMRKDFATYVKYNPNRDYGPALSPFNALMALNELRTLRSRMDLLSRSAWQVAAFLKGHPRVAAVSYPGLEDSPGYEFSRRYMRLVDSTGSDGVPENRFGHLLSFEVAGGATAAREVLDRLRLIYRSPDLGRIKSLATIPAISTHQQQGEAARALAGVPPSMIRLSVGGEHPEDIIADLDFALN
jgi:O-acetylhomoserine/O-acetylserine sulfhydrylase-like pyridoxal-dependent enzyme